MALGLYVHNKQTITNQMKGHRIWSAMVRPKFFDIPDDLKQLADHWKANSQTDPDKITEQKAARTFGAALVHRPELPDTPKGTQWKLN